MEWRSISAGVMPSKPEEVDGTEAAKRSCCRAEATIPDVHT